MDQDFTENQSSAGQAASKQLSMQTAAPPGEVPGYRLEEFLGAGAFGQVWTGTDLNTGRRVAVKFCLHRGGVNWSLLSHEVKNLVQLSADRYVVQVLEVGWDADPPYFVMELITGGSLEDMLRVRKSLPVTEAVALFRKICVGLNHCHGKGVLHCDLKPANVLLDQEQEPRLADFGQSRMTHDQTPALGTLFYMAPEQADLESTPDARWDVYAAGAILFRMLTGYAPHRHDSIIGQIDTAGSLPKRLQRYRKAVSDSPSLQKDLDKVGVDRALSRIVRRCLAIDPDHRYSNVQGVIDDLNRRDAARAQRPLTLLGIVGPLLLLVAVAIFAARTIVSASESTVSALRTAASVSNQLAARFAARTLEEEIRDYFAVAESESSQQEFLSVLKSALSDREVQQELAEIAGAGNAKASRQKTDQRERLFDVPARKELDSFLSKRLGLYTSDTANQNEPRLASMFVTDARGTIVGIAYDKPVSREDSSAGRNYSYRTYFHGGQNDLPLESPIDSIEPLTETHLSAAFQSTATGLWKCAISLPLDLDETRDGPEAVFVVTINLGDFELMQSETEFDLIAVLVDARNGPSRGTVLQHPLMDIRRDKGQSSIGQVYRVEADLMDKLSNRNDVDYVDPLAAAADGGAYAGDWIAAMQPVSLPNAGKNTGDGKTADLLVLVQYRLAGVLQPVGKMRRLLLQDGAAVLGSILMITVAMWYFVRRVNQDQGAKRLSAAEQDLAETVAAE